MAPTTTKTKRPVPHKAPAAPPRKPPTIPKTKVPVNKAVTPDNPDEDEPLIRIAFSVNDLAGLVGQLNGWDDAVAHRLRMRLAKHRQRWG